MECDKNQEPQKYQSLIQHLPQGYKDSYHRLTQYGAMFIICLHTVRRGREGKLKIFFFSRIIGCYLFENWLKNLEVEKVEITMKCFSFCFLSSNLF